MPSPVGGLLPRPVACQLTDSAGDNEATGKPVESERAWGHFTRRQSIALTFMREHVHAIHELKKGAWACLQAIAAHWQSGRTEAYPGQERLAMLTGYDARSIRVFTKLLETLGILVVVRLWVSDGTMRLHYEPGPGLLAAVERFDARYSDERTQPGEATPSPQAAFRRPPARRLGAHFERPPAHVLPCHGGPPPNIPDPPEVASPGGAEAISGELPDPGLKNSSSCSAMAPEEHSSNEEQGLHMSEMDRDVAREALAVHRQRSFGRGARLFDAGVVGLVAACASVIDGDRETKLRAQHDAIDHAFAVSRRNPTPSYIWGSIDHFLEHESCGRKARVDREKGGGRQARATEAERALSREWSRREREACGPPPEVLKFIAAFGRSKPSSAAGSRGETGSAGPTLSSAGAKG